MAMESKGDDLVKAANDHLPGRWTLFGADTKKEEAAEMLSRAGTAYKVAKNWDKAGDAYARAGTLLKEVGSEHEASQAFGEAAKAYKNVSHDRAIEIYLDEVLPAMVEHSRLDRAGKVYMEIGALHEADGNTKEALSSYQQAADMHMADSNQSNANKALAKIGFLAATEESYDTAVESFVRLAETSLESNLLKFNAKKHFLNAGLSLLARDKGHANEVEGRLAEWQAMDFTFETSRECGLLSKLVAACKDFNVDDFTDVVYEHDQISKLDPWTTTILLRIKNDLSKVATETVDLS